MLRQQPISHRPTTRVNLNALQDAVFAVHPVFVAVDIVAFEHLQLKADRIARRKARPQQPHHRLAVHDDGPHHRRLNRGQRLPALSVASRRLGPAAPGRCVRITLPRARHASADRIGRPQVHNATGKSVIAHRIARRISNALRAKRDLGIRTAKRWRNAIAQAALNHAGLIRAQPKGRRDALDGALGKVQPRHQKPRLYRAKVTAGRRDAADSVPS